MLNKIEKIIKLTLSISNEILENIPLTQISLSVKLIFLKNLIMLYLKLWSSLSFLSFFIFSLFTSILNQ